MDSMLVHSQALNLSLLHMGGEMDCESKVSYIRTQQNDPSEGVGTDCLIQSPTC